MDIRDHAIAHPVVESVNQEQKDFIEATVLEWLNRSSFQSYHPLRHWTLRNWLMNYAYTRTKENRDFLIQRAFEFCLADNLEILSIIGTIDSLRSNKLSNEISLDN